MQTSTTPNIDRSGLTEPFDKKEISLSVLMRGGLPGLEGNSSQQANVTYTANLGTCSHYYRPGEAVAVLETAISIFNCSNR